MIQNILTCSYVLIALGVIIGVIFKAFKLLEKQETQDKDILDIKKEQTVVCYALFSILDGLKQQGCNGQVTEAHDVLQKHINKQAHDQ